MILENPHYIQSSVMTPPFFHRDAVRNYLKWDFTPHTKDYYAEHLFPAADFLIRVNFFPCVFLLQKVVSSLLSSTYIHIKHSYPVPSHISMSGNTCVFASGPVISFQQVISPLLSHRRFCLLLHVALPLEYGHLLQLSSQTAIHSAVLSSLPATVWTHRQKHLTSASYFRSLPRTFSLALYPVFIKSALVGVEHV